MAKAKYGMVIDLERCIGCYSCAVGCKVENNVPMGMAWNRVLTRGGNQLDTAAGVFPKVEMEWLPLACQHCEDAPCVKVCPVGASYKAEDGRVLIDYDKCIGCRYCMAACPYGARSFNWSEPDRIPEHDTGDPDVKPRKRGVVEKCTLCEHRAAKGEEPFCVVSCPGRARIYGDLNDPNSEVSQLIARNYGFRFLEEKGTKPQVYYLPARRRK